MPRAEGGRPCRCRYKPLQGCVALICSALLYLLRCAAQLLDRDGSGAISAEELHAIALNIGEKASAIPRRALLLMKFSR